MTPTTQHPHHAAALQRVYAAERKAHAFISRCREDGEPGVLTIPPAIAAEIHDARRALAELVAQHGGADALKT